MLRSAYRLLSGRLCWAANAISEIRSPGPLGARVWAFEGCRPRPLCGTSLEDAAAAAAPMEEKVLVFRSVRLTTQY